MSDCALCNNANTCIKCGSVSFLDTGTKNCIADCI